MEEKIPHHDHKMMDDYNQVKSTLSLNQFITMVSLDNNEKTVIQLARQFLIESKCESDWRVGMEFLYMNGFYNDLNVLIERNKHSDNPINRKGAQIYELMIARLDHHLPSHVVIEQVNNITTDIPELKCLIRFLTISINFSAHKYDCLGYYLDEINSLMLHIENPLLASLYKARLNMLLFIYYWKRNELILARKHAYRALNQTYNLERKSQLHINLGLSYIYDDYTSCVYHLNEALKFAEMFNNKRLIRAIKDRNYPFVCAHFGVVENLKTNDPSEQAHIEIAKGNFQGAKAILRGIDEITPFRKYYLGLATGERDLFISSYNDFIEKRSDHFFARLPLHELKHH
ncbi:AimR family lysis-lysogeny pheromone receptor [Aquibacillus rhizosphaerae]|uniref:AimR family lysis-lysogeny pheromone receptor n=1 Tax=Aquibacillus rhizosphaerae TaxID=3051431 RepID=A0ABT7L2Q9_9BACI|nr:AimR family lysis-lysogeny pheromone receptor [Aquibacillus sp. LR5S19]MDL4838870.1 AimR family lysis-lysogeny pheromone receptor [Aquibacillus sp. LR5S19]